MKVEGKKCVQWPWVVGRCFGTRIRMASEHQKYNRETRREKERESGKKYGEIIATHIECEGNLIKCRKWRNASEQLNIEQFPIQKRAREIVDL